MKIISIPKDFQSADGTPFADAKRDNDGNVIFRKTKEAKDGEVIHTIQMIDGKSVAVAVPEVEVLKYLGVLKVALRRIQDSMIIEKQGNRDVPGASKPIGITFEDTGHAIGVIRCINVSQDGVLELDPHDHEWLLEKAQKYLPDTMGFNAFLVIEPIKNAIDKAPENRAQRKREGKKG